MACSKREFDVARIWLPAANDEAGASVDERQAYRIAAAAFLRSRKATPKAIRRCRRRAERALRVVRESVSLPDAPPDAALLAAKAGAWIELACEACGRCEGAAIKRPRRS